jgi:hypothetical protein
MKKLAIVGIVLSGVLMSAAIAQAKPVGMSNAEYQALMIRSEGLNQKYGVGEKSQQAIIREKLGEIGAWAVPSTSTVGSKPLAGQSQQAMIREKLGEIGAWAVPSTSTVGSKPLAGQSQQAMIREKLGEIGAWAVPSTSTPTPVVSSSGGFDWNDVGIGASVLGAMLLGIASLVTIRRHQHHGPVAH